MRIPKVRLGLLGAGVMGTQVAAAAARAGRFEVVSVADPNVAAASALAAGYGSAVYGDFETLCAAGDLDAVYIGLPHHLHADACVAAALADLHVLIDKPLCNTLAEADRIRDAASGSARVWMVGFSYRYRTEWRRAQEVVAAGGIGTPYFASDVIAEAYQRLPAWYLDAAMGGGALQLQAHHSFDRLAWLLGTAPTRIACRVSRFPDSADHTANLLAAYPSGVNAAISVALSHGYQVDPRMLFVVQGDGGMIEIDESRTLRHTTANGTSVENYADDDWLERELTGFANAIADLGADFPGIPEGRAALQCVLAAIRAATSEVWESVDD